MEQNEIIEGNKPIEVYNEIKLAQNFVTQPTAEELNSITVRGAANKFKLSRYTARALFVKYNIPILSKGRVGSHNKWKSKEWNSWNHMKGRCYNPNHVKFKDYGGRGISVCDRWLLFKNFYDDMGDAPSKSHTLDRIDVNGNYNPLNCKWSTPKEQCINKRNTVLVSYNGQSHTVTDWAILYNISKGTLFDRIFKQKLSIDKALEK